MKRKIQKILDKEYLNYNDIIELMSLTSTCDYILKKYLGIDFVNYWFKIEKTVFVNVLLNLTNDKFFIKYSDKYHQNVIKDFIEYELNTIPDYLRPHILLYKFTLKPKLNNKTFIISYDAFNDCVAEGSTIEETILNGQNALRNYLITLNEYDSNLIGVIKDDKHIHYIAKELAKVYDNIIDDFINEEGYFDKDLIKKVCLEEKNKI